MWYSHKRRRYRTLEYFNNLNTSQFDLALIRKEATLVWYHVYREDEDEIERCLNMILCPQLVKTRVLVARIGTIQGAIDGGVYRPRNG